MAQLSSGSRINSAADDPAGFAISQEMTSQINGYQKGTENAASTNDLLNTADGALSSINDNLQRMRELAVQASNGTLTAGDKKILQNEIVQIKESIQETVKNTEFNTIKLIDGTFSDNNLAAGPNGSGRSISIKNTSLETLGIDQFDLTKDFDIGAIDNAINMVSESRSSIGANMNAIDHLINANQNAAQNLTNAESQISGADMAKLATSLKEQQLQQRVQLYAQQSKMEQSSSVLNLLK